MRVIAEGLAFPEGPVAMADGSVVFVEIQRGTLSRTDQHGRVHVVSEPGGGPNGAALGPDGSIYVCNNGGGDFVSARGPAYSGGRIEVVDPETGRFERLYDRCGELPLSAPNDLVFDAHGGFWFTDFGKRSQRSQVVGSVYWARADGSEIREVITGLHSPNGIGLSPGGAVLYVAETLTARLWSWPVTAPGQVARTRGTTHGGTFVVGSDDYRRFDSLAVAESGRVLVGTLESGGITEIDPAGRSCTFHAMPDRLITNVCFGGDGLRTAYLTLSRSGRLVSIPWHEPGLRLQHQI